MNWKQKKVTFVTGSLTGGGAEKVVSILASGCADLGADVALVILRNRKRTYNISNKVNVYQINAEKSKFKLLLRIKELRSIFKDRGSNTVITFLPIITLYALLANVNLDNKIIASERGDPYLNIFTSNLSYKDMIGQILMRKLQLFGLADYVVFQTSDAQNYYCKEIRLKSCIIPNPLNLTNLKISVRNNQHKQIIAAGRLTKEKNFSLLIQAFAEFHNDFPMYKLFIYGEGPLRQELEALVQDLKLESFVLLPGFSENLILEMSKSSLYVSVSNHEGISNSMLEALGMGLPTIATDCPIGGAKMFVRTGVNGVLIPMNDKKSLVNAMERIVSDVDFCRESSENIEKFRNYLSPKAICEKWLSLI